MNKIFNSGLQISVEAVPDVRFLGNEAFLFRVMNGSYLPYFGSIAIDNDLPAKDFRLHCDTVSQTKKYKFRIDVSIYFNPKKYACHFYSHF